MIKTCKYCAKQERSCDECHSPVITRTISEILPERPYKVIATFLLCTNIECSAYGMFLKETGPFVKVYTCDSFSCQQKAKYTNEIKDFNSEVLGN